MEQQTNGGMTPEQMQQRSHEKVKEVQNLMNTLKIRVEAREHLTREGFLEKVVFFIDEEQYSPVVNQGSAAPETQNHESPSQAT